MDTTIEQNVSVAFDGHDLDTNVGEQLGVSEAIVEQYFDAATQRPVIAHSVEEIATSKLKANGKPIGPRDLALATRAAQNVIKERCAQRATSLDGVPVDLTGPSPWSNPSVGQIRFAALTDADFTLGQLVGDENIAAIAVFYQGDIAPLKEWNGEMLANKFAKQNYLGICATFATLEDAEMAREELLQAVRFAAVDRTDSAMEGDPIRESLSTTPPKPSTFDVL